MIGDTVNTPAFQSPLNPELPYRQAHLPQDVQETIDSASIREHPKSA